MSSRLEWWWSGIALDVRWGIGQVRSFQSSFKMDVRCYQCWEAWSFCTRWRSSTEGRWSLGEPSHIHNLTVIVKKSSWAGWHVYSQRCHWGFLREFLGNWTMTMTSWPSTGEQEDRWKELRRSSWTFSQGQTQKSGHPMDKKDSWFWMWRCSKEQICWKATSTDIWKHRPALEGSAPFTLAHHAKQWAFADLVMTKMEAHHLLGREKGPWDSVSHGSAQSSKRRRTSTPRYGSRPFGWFTLLEDQGVTFSSWLSNREIPRNGERMTMLHGGHGYPSFLCWPETDPVMIAYSDVIEVRVDQGALGHKRKKPTTLVTNIHEVKLMNGLQDDSVQRPWPTSLQARMEESRSLAEWAPELKNLLLSVAIRVHRGQPPLRLRTTVPRMNALTAAERKDMEMWQNHINQEHLPMRRDCHDCLLAMGRDRPRRRQVCPASYCLSIDVAGPFEPGVDQLAGNPRYFLIGCYTLPVSQGVALTEAIGKLGGQVKMTPLDEGEEKDGIVLGEYYDYHLEENEKALAELDQVDTYLAGMEQQMELQHEEEEERNIFSETELDPPRLASENVPNQEDVQAPEDPPQGELDGVFVERREKPEEALPEVLVRELDLQNARWKNKIAELKEVEVVNLTLAVPLRSRHAPEVLRAVSSLYVRLRGLGLPIYRLHSDRAREFTGKLMRDWILSHDMEHTTTAADESAGNGRVESEIAHLKHHTKLLLTTARAPPTYWPMALRHASEYRLRKTLEQLGVPVPRLIPFGTEAIAKSKFWHRTMKGFPTPMQKVKVWGPAVGMSLSSKGYWIEADGKWMRSTVVVQPGARPDQRPELPVEDQTELLDNASIAMSEDQPDVVATNQVDEAGHPVVNLENIDQDDQVQWVPKRRFHMKKPLIPGSEDATLRMRMLCSNRGECSQEEALDNAWATLEHLHLRKLETEERQLTTGDQQSMEVIAQLEEQCKNIEKNMEDQKASREGREGEAVVEEEVLVNQPVSLEEVRRNLPQWKEALKKEYDSLIGYGAIRPIGSKEYAELQEQYEVVESIPTMLVAVKKPPLKLKARVVACGNHAQEATGCTTAGGVDTVVVRTLVSLAAHKDLTILTSDIKTAFLQAPRRLTPGRVTILTPPAILREAQLLQLQGERWVVEKAMYGLTESPKDWGDYRNLRMSSMKWSSQGFQRWLRRSPEPHLWEVCQQDVVAEESQPSVICHVAVYVDDLMVTGKREDAREVMDQLAKTFQMTSPEEVSESQEVTFCGYQIQKTETGFALHQQKYVQEVLQKHGIQCSESVPCLKISDGPEEQEPAREDIKQAQIVTGELGWLTSRTRPDIAFSVSIMARMIHKRPKWVTETGMQVLKYLHGSKGWGLNYTRIDDPTVLNVLVDASYAPPHEGYRSVQGAIYMHGSNVLMWSSSRQGFITQSTAEAELLAYNESAQGAESVAHLLECFDMKVARRLIGDSKSGLVQLTGEVGSWRTRHLRLRSAKLRELIQHGVDGWHAVRRDGKELAADGMTKPLAGQAFVRFRSMLFMKDCDKKDAKENTICIPAVKTCSQVDSSTSLRDLGCGLLGAGSALLATGNKKLALALVASGVALCWKEGGKRPASKAIEQRPHKSPENEGGKGQTMLGKGGAAHLKEESRAGTTEEVSKSMRIQELETVGRSPGLRAYRVSGAGSRSSHGSSSSAGPSTSADPSTEERRGLRVPPGLSPFPEGALFDDASGLLEQGQQVPRQRRALTEDERRQLNREMRERIQSLEERVDRLTLEGESVRKNPEETVVKNEMKSERRYEGMQRALVPAEKPRTRMAQWNNHHGRDRGRQALQRQALEALGQWFNKGLDGGFRSLKQWLVVHRALNGPRMWRVRSRKHHGRGTDSSFDQQVQSVGTWVCWRRGGSWGFTRKPGNGGTILYTARCRWMQESYKVFEWPRGSWWMDEWSSPRTIGQVKIALMTTWVGAATLSWNWVVLQVMTMDRMKWSILKIESLEPRCTKQEVYPGFGKSHSPKGGVCLVKSLGWHAHEKYTKYSGMTYCLPKAFLWGSKQCVACLIIWADWIWNILEPLFHVQSAVLSSCCLWGGAWVRRSSARCWSNGHCDWKWHRHMVKCGPLEHQSEYCRYE